MESESNYEKTKRDARQRFTGYDQERIIKRLALESDASFIYLNFIGQHVRIRRDDGLMEKEADTGKAVETDEHGNRSKISTPDENRNWMQTNFEEALTIYDLLCHTAKPVQLSGDFTTLEGLNRVVGGSSNTSLGNGFFLETELFFDGKDLAFSKACTTLGGTPAGKGDVSFRIPLWGPIDIQLSFYDSDDEFPAKLTILFDSKICDYLFYETLWYASCCVLKRVRELM